MYCQREEDVKRGSAHLGRNSHTRRPEGSHAKGFRKKGPPLCTVASMGSPFASGIQPQTLDPHSKGVDNGSDENGKEHEDEGRFRMVSDDQPF
jgi:hypothetical protein